MTFPYVKNTTWVSGGAPTIDAAALNQIETQFDSVLALLTTRGDIIYRGATTWERLPKGTLGHSLVMGTNDPQWAAVNSWPHIKLNLHAHYAVGQGTWVPGTHSITTSLDPIQEPYIDNDDSETNGDNISYKVWLKAGSYKGYITYRRASNCGILQVLLGATEIASFDAYNSSSVNTFGTIASFSITTDGEYTITFKVNGKNASSSSYVARFNSVCIARYA